MTDAHNEAVIAQWYARWERGDPRDDQEIEDQRRQMEEEAMAEWRAEQEAARWDTDPNPYHGDYSED